MTRTAIVLGLAVASLAILSACSQEDYYCDDGGCYYCDGVGCRPVAPPARTACACDRNCAAGSACTTLGCTIACSSGSTCPHGTVCRGGWCAGPRETMPAAASIACECMTADDCNAYEAPGEDLGCVDGECVPRVRPQCDATVPCPSGYECVDGECRLPAETCRFSSECGPGRICVDQRCTIGCMDSSGCPMGSACEGGFCREQPGMGECFGAGDCGSGQVCIDGQCWSACTMDSDCGTGRYCGADGRCRFDDRPRPTCDASRPCAAGAVCIEGVCRSPCNTPTDCRRFDEQLTFCVDNLCYTTTEATSDCSSSAQCMAGQSCVDGICR